MTTESIDGRGGGSSAVVVSSGDAPGKQAWHDFLDGARRWELWTTLGRQDIRHRYRRSHIGPFWLTISMATFIGMLSFVYGGLFGLDLESYLPYLATSFILWGLMSTFLLEGCSTFIQVESVIKQVRLPFFLHVYRVVFRNLVVFAHNSVIYVAVVLWFDQWPGWVALLFLPALAVLVVNGLCAAVVLGILSARFRDIPQIMATLVQMAFLLTPVIWHEDILPERAALVPVLNPFRHYLEILRAPLLGEVPSALSWGVVAACTLAGIMLAVGLFVRCRKRIAYWA